MINVVSRPARPLEPLKSKALLTVAGDAFATEGLDGASLNDILSRAGMGKGSFYHRFADKAALHDWVTTTMAQLILSEIAVPDLRALTAASFRPELSALLVRFQRLAAAQPELMNLGRMFHNSADAPPGSAISTVRSAVIGWITAALATGRDLGVIRSDLPADLLSAWTVASLSTIDTWVLDADGDPASLGEVAAKAVDAFWGLLAR